MATRTKIQIKHLLSHAQVLELHGHVAELMRTAVAESWTGGGDPDDAPVIEAELALAKARFDCFVARLERGE